MADPISEAKTEDLMTETRQLHDRIYNIKCYSSQDMTRLEALYAEIERRGIAVVEQYDVNFVESVVSDN